MDCRRRSAVDDDRSRRKWVIDEDRRRRRWAVDDDRRRRRWAVDDEDDDYPPLQLPLQWRDPPPHYPREERRQRRRAVDDNRRRETLRAAQVEASLDRIDAFVTDFNRSLERIRTSAIKLSSDIYRYSLSPPGLASNVDSALARLPPFQHPLPDSQIPYASPLKQTRNLDPLLLDSAPIDTSPCVGYSLNPSVDQILHPLELPNLHDGIPTPGIQLDPTAATPPLPPAQTELPPPDPAASGDVNMDDGTAPQTPVQPVNMLFRAHTPHNHDSADDATQDLRSLVDRMIVAGYGRECFQVYGSVRMSAMELCFHHLGIQRLSIGNIQRRDWVALGNQPLQDLIFRLQIRQQQVEIQESLPLNHEQNGSSIQDEILPASFGGTIASSNGATLQAAATIASQISIAVATQLTQQRELYKARETGSLPRNDLIGRGKDKEFVMQRLRKPSKEHLRTGLYRNISLLSIVRHGGTGKTTLLQHIYEDEMTEEFDLKMSMKDARRTFDGISSYYRDSLSVAAFGAMEQGVFVACSTQKGDQELISLTNVSPWMATIGVSTMDRNFPATARLWNGVNLTGDKLMLIKLQSIAKCLPDIVKKINEKLNCNVSSKTMGAAFLLEVCNGLHALSIVGINTNDMVVCGKASRSGVGSIFTAGVKISCLNFTFKAYPMQRSQVVRRNVIEGWDLKFVGPKDGKMIAVKRFSSAYEKFAINIENKIFDPGGSLSPSGQFK